MLSIFNSFKPQYFSSLFKINGQSNSCQMICCHLYIIDLFVRLEVLDEGLVPVADPDVRLCLLLTVYRMRPASLLEVVRRSVLALGFLLHFFKGIWWVEIFWSHSIRIVRSPRHLIRWFTWGGLWHGVASLRLWRLLRVLREWDLRCLIFAYGALRR